LTLYLLLGLSSATLALVLTPLVARGALVLGVVDAPGGRKVHTRAVPRLGGVGVVAATILAMILVPLFVPERSAPTLWASLRPLAAGGALVFTVGLLDDFRGVGALAKLAVQAVAAIVLMTSGLLIETVTVLGTTWHLGWLSWPVTGAWVVGLTNAFNLIDGVDGLAAGVAALAGAACCAILIARGHAAEAMLLAALVGAAAGFLAFNFAPASIFLGDSGSLVFGFLLAGTAIAGWQKGATALAAGIPILIFALPIADVGSTIVRRGLAPTAGGRPSLRSALARLVEPDRQHIHHRLLALGWSPRRTVLVLYSITGLLALLALATARVP
jgi:UDP-GlcNAc:undecaprenyl-phosphate GlcNAc-1-phosphate transferase